MYLELKNKSDILSYSGMLDFNGYPYLSRIKYVSERKTPLSIHLKMEDNRALWVEYTSDKFSF